MKLPKGSYGVYRQGVGLQNAHESFADQNSLLKIPQLVTPLREDTDRVLDECHDD